MVRDWLTKSYMSKSYFQFFFLAQLMVSCVSSRPSPDYSLISAQLKERLEQLKSEKNSCAMKLNLDCEGLNDNPSLCVLNTTTRLGEESVFIDHSAFGRNLCEAEIALRIELCKQPAAFDNAKITCYPDPAAGECLSLQNNCKTSSDVQRETICFSKKYDDQILWDGFVVAGWAKSRCAAEYEMLKQACRHHLRPSKLGSRHCETTSIVDECNELVQRRCEAGNYDPHFCYSELKTDHESKVLSSFSFDRCRAEKELLRKACNVNISPQTVQKTVRCESFDVIPSRK